MNPETIRFLAHRAADAYVPPRGSTILKDKYGQVRGFAMVDDSSILIAISGTKSKLDAIIDLKAWKTHVLDFGVHAGFWGEYETLRPYVMSLIRVNPGKVVRVCGHSLGGALAVLVAAEAAALERRVELVTLGCPRVGNWAFTRFLKRLGVKHVRIVHGFDGVPHVPWIFYWHYGELLHLDSQGRPIGAARKPFHLVARIAVTFWKALRGQPVKDHFLDGYLDVVDKFSLLKGEVA